MNWADDAGFCAFLFLGICLTAALVLLADAVFGGKR